MPLEKVSLTLDADLLSQAREAAGHRGLSSFVNEALRIKLQHERLRRLLDQMDLEFGPIPDDELKRARKVWPAAKKKSRRAA
jgi:Arc/MetJ family transcription regulator